MIIRGDSYALSIAVTIDGRTPDIRQVACAEICLAGSRKCYDGADGPVTWDEDNEVFCLPLTQAETLAVRSGGQPIQLRVKFTDGSVYGTPIRYVTFGDVISGEVL